MPDCSWPDSLNAKLPYMISKHHTMQGLIFALAILRYGNAVMKFASLNPLATAAAIRHDVTNRPN